MRSDHINTSFIWNTIIQQTGIQKTESRFFRMVKDKQENRQKTKTAFLRNAHLKMINIYIK